MTPPDIVAKAMNGTLTKRDMSMWTANFSRRYIEHWTVNKHNKEDCAKPGRCDHGAHIEYHTQLLIEKAQELY